MTPREAIVAELCEVRADIERKFTFPDNRAPLLTLLRCIDHQWFVVHECAEAGRPLPDPPAFHESDRLFKWGWNEAIQRYWKQDVEQPGIPMFPTDPWFERWGNALLHTSGRIRLAEFILEMDRLRLGRLSASPGIGNTYDFHLVSDATGVESVELADENYLRAKMVEMHERKGTWKRLARRRKAAHRRMAKLVGPYADHFIRYDADPLVDEFYQDWAEAVSSTKTGWDAFPPQTMFGGMRFEVYLTGVQTLLGFAQKHLDFCSLLTKQHPRIDPMDVVAFPSVWSRACSSLAAALGSTEVEAERIVRATSITAENASVHLATPAGPAPMHFVIGGGFLVRSIRGCLDNPFHFLLRELRRNFGGDWDRAVDDRERSFRKELFALLSRYDWLRCLHRNLNISTDVGPTDIDAIVHDPRNGAIAYFQLKWQDPFAGSMRQRETKKGNFLDAGNGWVAKVASWIKSGRMTQSLISSGLPKQDARGIKETHLFVLGRSFSHFSGAYAADPRAAWGTWAQVVRLVDETVVGDSPLRGLYEALRADAPSARVPKEVRGEEFPLGKLTIRTHPGPSGV